MLKIGQRVGNYRVTRVLGQGAMGAVFEVVHLEIDRRAAIKVLNAELSSKFHFVTRFLNEARAVNLVRHPGLVEIFEFGRLPSGIPYIVMELLEGDSLEARLQRLGGRLCGPAALEVARQIAAALSAAHHKGITHRDLKPGNVMLVPDPEHPDRERVKVLDFGVAKLAGDAGLRESWQAKTLTGAILGTPQYMAPEQCIGSTDVGGKADVYSLGVLLYQMLSGRLPFEAPLALDVMTMHLRAAPPPLGDLDPAIDPRWAALVMDMLAKEPAARPAMGEVLGRVGALLPDVGPGPAPVLPRVPSGPAPQPPPEAPCPFVAGPPISQPRYFFGRERELRRLFGLWQRTPLQNAAIIGPRRAGKTSLLLYLKNILSAQDLRPGQRSDWLPAPDPVRFVFVDFQDPRMGAREGLLRHLLGGMGMPVPSPCDLERFLDVLSDRLHTRTVILLDEVDLALARHAELDDSFWEALRALATNQVDGNLGFVLASHDLPQRLARDSHRSSPFFNIFGYTTTLGPLSEPDARELMRSSPIPIPDRHADWILEQSGRWPILLQILCRECFIALQEGGPGEGWEEEALRQMVPFQHLL